MKNHFFPLLFVLVFSSCSVLNPEQMLRTPRDYEYSDLNDLLITDQYRLAPNDEISFQLFTNDGERLIDPVTMLSNQNLRQQQLTYRVEYDGTIKLPVLGRTTVSGLTTREAEAMLENAFTEFYNNPFVQLRVVNNRVIIFPGGRGGTSRVLYLENPNTTLFEALAQSGGIADGKSSRVKLIRGGPENPRVYLVNLSTIDGVKNANLVLQANDIIYVEPRERVPQRILENVTPYLSLITTALLVYSLFTN
ncbi:MAG: polysaccharide biosynthesis/export family protein [Bacteroides sp.]|nr:polysaccharide biosynthesis/export family protein [Bacteroides sp.]